VENVRGTHKGVSKADGLPLERSSHRAAKILNDLKAQLMQLCDGDVGEYNLLYNAPIEIYIRKFEHHIKQSNNGKGTT